MRWGWRGERERWREREKNWQEACIAVSGCSEEYRLWHPLVVLHTLCLIKHTSNTIADFLSHRVGRRAGARVFRLCVCVCVCAWLHVCWGKRYWCFVYLKWVNPKQNKHSVYSGCDVDCCKLRLSSQLPNRWLMLMNDPVCVFVQLCVCMRLSLCELMHVRYFLYYDSPATLFTSIKLFAINRSLHLLHFMSSFSSFAPIVDLLCISVRLKEPRLQRPH